MRAQEKDSVGCYLDEIARYPLLSKTEEIELGRQIKASERLKETIAAESREPTAEEKRTIVIGDRAIDRMVKSNLRLVVRIAKTYNSRIRNGNAIDLMDLVQEGTIGLKRGAAKFDIDRNYKFSTYAYHWIRQAITRMIHDQGRTVRLPAHIHEKMNKIRRVSSKFAQENGRYPDSIELAELAKIKPAKLSALQQAFRPIVSIDRKFGENQDEDLYRFIPAEADRDSWNIVESNDRKYEIETFYQAAKLNDREKQFIELRWGLIGEPRDRPLSYAAIGKEMDCSGEYARQLCTDIMRRLRLARDKYVFSDR